MKRLLSLFLCLALALAVCAGALASPKANSAWPVRVTPRTTMVRNASGIELGGMPEVNYYVGANTVSDEVWSWNLLTEACVTNAAELRAEGLTGMPEWTVEQTAGDKIRWYTNKEEINRDEDRPGVTVRLDDIPNRAFDAKITFTCKWGGRTATYVSTVHFKKVELPKGISGIEDTYVVRPGDSLTLAPKVRPSGWSLPGYSLSLARNSGDFEEFAEVTETGNRIKLKVKSDAADGIYECLVALGADTLTMGKFIHVLVASKPIDLSKVTFRKIGPQVYTGKKIQPDVAAVYEDWFPLKAGEDFTVTYTDNKNVGTATAVVKGKGLFTGSKKITFTINPKPVKLSSLSAGKKQLAVRWKKGSGIDGYEIQYSLKKDFKGAKSVKVKDASAVKTGLKNLKAGKTYYVRIRTWKTVGKKTYSSEWSAVKSKKTK